MEQTPQNELGNVPPNSANAGNLRKASEGFGKVPNDSESFGSVRKGAEGFRDVPKASERTENHTLTVREAARLFETAGVARTERSIVNWCQPNRQGICRLDSYFDPNERKYYLTPQSVERVIEEEIQRANRLSESATSEAFGTVPTDSVKAQKLVNAPETNGERVKELERENLDLKIANRGKDFLIEQMRNERDGFFEQLLAASKRVGTLEAKILQIESSAGNQTI